MAYQDELLRAILGSANPQNPLGEALGPQFQGGVPSIESRLSELRQLMTAESPDPNIQRQPYSTGEIVSLIASALGDALTARTAAKTRQYWQPMYVPGTLGILEGKRAGAAQAATEKAKSQGERARQLAALEYQDLLAGRNRADVAEERRLTAKEARLENERIADERQRAEFEFKTAAAKQAAEDKKELKRMSDAEKAAKNSEKADAMRGLTEKQLIDIRSKPIQIRLDRLKRDYDLAVKKSDDFFSRDDPEKVKANEAKIQRISDEIDAESAKLTEIEREVTTGPGSSYYYRQMTPARWKAMTPDQQREFVSIYGRKPEGVK